MPGVGRRVRLAEPLDFCDGSSIPHCAGSDSGSDFSSDFSSDFDPNPSFASIVISGSVLASGFVSNSDP